MRAALALVLLVACGKHATMTQQACDERADAIEARGRTDEENLEMLQLIQTAVDPGLLNHPGVPDAEEASTEFARGVVVPISADKPAIIEAIAASEACAAKESKRPVRLYLSAPSEQDNAVAESAAWLVRAGKAWNVDVSARRIVHLPTERDMIAWPPKWSSGRALAKKRKKDDAAIYVELKRVTRGCDEVYDLFTSHDNLARAGLELPDGLRKCGCTVPDLDEAEGVWQAIFSTRTQLGWIPPPEGTSRRSVFPLSCEDANDPVIVGTDEHWPDGAPDIRPALLGVLHDIAECRDAVQFPAGIVHVYFTGGVDEIKVELIALNPRGMDLSVCMKDKPSHSIALETANLGSTDVLIYLPGATTRAP